MTLREHLLQEDDIYLATQKITKIWSFQRANNLQGLWRDIWLEINTEIYLMPQKERQGLLVDIAFITNKGGIVTYKAISSIVFNLDQEITKDNETLILYEYTECLLNTQKKIMGDIYRKLQKPQLLPGYDRPYELIDFWAYKMGSSQCHPRLMPEYIPPIPLRPLYKCVDVDKWKPREQYNKNTLFSYA